MSFTPGQPLSRRKFLGSCCAAVGTTGLLSALAQLRLIGAIASPGASATRATAAASDYKALVCLFLQGGNDANNLLIPNDTAGYASYAAARGALVLPQTGLLPLSPRTSDGRAFALHPSMPEFQNLFAGGQAAVLANVGTLVVPTTKAQYTAKSVPLPNQLFSHSDQQVEWQSSLPDRPFTTGWGGRLADLTNAFNENNTISMSISLAGQNSFQVGQSVAQFSVKSTGPVALSGSSQSNSSLAGIRTRAQSDLLAASQSHLLDTAFGTVTRDAISDSALLAEYVGSTAGIPFSTVFPDSSLGQQLQMIARLIASAPALGLKRQVFFAALGGWDLHDSQLVAHSTLLGDVSASLQAFYAATVELGVASQVTTFTASDFGRTYNTNGDGSDHGWGSHHLVVGGAVQGRDIFGHVPDLTINGPNDTGRGRWIPTTSVDEYAATLATWFGVSPTDLPIVLPNIGRFAQPNLGFLG
ncbi:DUF1501 domain-containing protein [Horticoccus luteus]|uniref:DUF1501 domain-containing protein n=1 Tax=Horticoccus luteus TaxID=2862869 RepID=A0A8F9TTF0_9BACT|nr:DUF1501 domain-containing protein [Horticoccus luteus]QYM77772.1 DUF1501 domain-containing protein [Horticoccus luteus]